MSHNNNVTNNSFTKPYDKKKSSINLSIILEICACIYISSQFDSVFAIPPTTQYTQLSKLM